MNDRGTVVFSFTQGETEKVVDVTGGFSGYIDLSGFSPGIMYKHTAIENPRNFSIVIRHDHNFNDICLREYPGMSIEECRCNPCICRRDTFL